MEMTEIKFKFYFIYLLIIGVCQTQITADDTTLSGSNETVSSIASTSASNINSETSTAAIETNFTNITTEQTTLPSNDNMVTSTQLNTEMMISTQSNTEMMTSTQLNTEMVPSTQSNTEMVPSTQLNTETVPSTQLNTETVPSTQSNTETVPSTQSNTEIVTSTQSNTETVPSTQLNTETVPSTQLNTEMVSSTQLNTEMVSSTQLNTEMVSSTQLNTETVPSTQLNTETVPSTQSNTETVPSTQSNTETVPSTQSNTETVPSTQLNTETVPSTQSNTETVPSTQSNTETVPSTQSNTETVPSTQSNTETVPSTQLNTEMVPSTQLSTEMVTNDNTASVSTSQTAGTSLNGATYESPTTEVYTVSDTTSITTTSATTFITSTSNSSTASSSVSATIIVTSSSATHSTLNVTHASTSIASNTMEEETTMMYTEFEETSTATIVESSASDLTSSNMMEMETTFENLETETGITSITTITGTSLSPTTTSIYMSSITTNPITTVSTTPSYNPNTCNSTSQVALDNGTCVLNSDGQVVASNILNNGTGNSTTLADALTLYFQSIADANGLSSNTVLASTIDKVVSNLGNVSLTRSTNSSFLMVLPINQSDTVAYFGALFERGSGGESVRGDNIDKITNSTPTVEAVLTHQSLIGVTYLNMLIINKPTMYEQLDTSIDSKSLASSVIVVGVQRSAPTSAPINISLFFKVLPEYAPNVSATYLCSFYDANNSIWNETGCTLPYLNTTYNRYECSCNHLTSFALTSTPKISQTNSLSAQDITSLACLSFSIFCFVLALIYIFIMRIINPIIFLEIRNLLPLISSASTTILFAFYIALTMTIYTRLPSPVSSTVSIPCFTSASTLMFFFYFFLIFMFCVKTSMTCYNYLRFIRLFPDPSYRKLILLLILSFFMAIAWTSFAAGFNSSSSFQITQLQGNKLCWFTQDVVYYFVAIPVGVFLLLSFLIVIFVAKHIIHHMRRATSPHQSYERIKLCVLVLLTSSITQGIAWLFAPYISFVHLGAANVLGWFFVVFNGLEGLWTILLCIIIHLQLMDEHMRIHIHRDLTVGSNRSLTDPARTEHSSIIRDAF